MSGIIKAKNGKLHIYVRQDTYKGKLKSENWVGRTFFQGKQKVISSGTKDLEEAKKILEKWYDDLQNSPEGSTGIEINNNEVKTSETVISGANNQENTQIIEDQKYNQMQQVKNRSLKKAY